MSNKFVVNRLNHLNRLGYQAGKTKKNHVTDQMDFNQSKSKEDKQAIIEKMKNIQKGEM